jgi:hypothetical protein
LLDIQAAKKPTIIEDLKMTFDTTDAIALIAAGVTAYVAIANPSLLMSIGGKVWRKLRGAA